MIFWVAHRRELFLKAGILLLAGLAVITGQLAFGQGVPATGHLRAITRADSPDDRVALTYDLTWGEAELAQVLAALDAAGVKATFFVAHQWAATNPAQLRALVAAGHEVGTLGMKMLDPTTLQPTELATHLTTSQSQLARTLQKTARWYRPFGGKHNDAVIQTAWQAGLSAVTWSLDASDAVEPPPTAAETAKRVVSLARRGDIVHLNASDFARNTGEATAAITVGLQKKGLRMVTLSQLVPVE